MEDVQPTTQGDAGADGSAEGQPKTTRETATSLYRLIKALTTISNYTDPQSSTYGSLGKSHMPVYRGKSQAAASVEASRLLSGPIGQQARAILEQEAGPQVKVRLQALDNIVRGEYRKTTIFQKPDEQGELQTVQVITTSPSPADIARAADVLSRIDGTYQARAVEARQMDRELSQLYDAQRRKLRQAMRNVTAEAETTHSPSLEPSSSHGSKGTQGRGVNGERALEEDYPSQVATSFSQRVTKGHQNDEEGPRIDSFVDGEERLTEDEMKSVEELLRSCEGLDPAKGVVIKERGEGPQTEDERMSVAKVVKVSNAPDSGVQLGRL